MNKEKFEDNIIDLSEFDFINNDLPINTFDDPEITKIVIGKPFDGTNHVKSKNSFNILHIHKIKRLKNLKALELPNTKFTDYSFISELKQLEYLDISENEIFNVDFVEELRNLKHLNIGFNKIVNISCISKLMNLEELVLSGNLFRNLIPIKELSKLKYLTLDLSRVDDFDILKKHKELRLLSLRENNISDIGFLSNLNKIELLFLDNNKIEDITPLLHLLKKGLDFEIGGSYYTGEKKWANHINLIRNPISKIPYEILESGSNSIIEFYDGAKKKLNECKLIFVGDGAVGKTSLMKRIVYGDFNAKESTTHGINKVAWNTLTNDQGEKIKVNLWDFGGQHIQHSLHQFFFSKRVIYVLVLNPRNDEKAHYWIDQIEKIGCDSEILIVYNWKEAKDKKAEYLGNFYELRKKYPKLRDPFLLSCKTGDGIDLFLSNLKTTILNNESLKVEYRTDWFNLKNKLENEIPIAKNFIDFETFKDWCNNENYHDNEKQKSLLKILDSVGSIVFFDKPILNQLQILNPEWITTGAYSILTSEITREKKGHLNWFDLLRIFETEKEVFSNETQKIKYLERHFHFIIQLMVEYQICQENPFKNGEYLIPSAFDGTPKKKYDDLLFEGRRYKFNFKEPFEMLIIHRFIAKNISKLIDNDYWNSGIYIKDPNSNTYAIVESNLYSNEINCYIHGENIRGLWELIRFDFREIFKSYHNFYPEELVEYRSNEKSVFLPYSEMLNSLKHGRRIIDFHPTYQIENIDVLKVLDLFEEKLATEKHFNIPNQPSHIINLHQDFSPKISLKNENTFEPKIEINLSQSDSLNEIKELLLDLEEYNIKNEEWKEILIKALTEFNKIENESDQALIKTSISIVERIFKRMKDMKDVWTIGFLPVDAHEKMPKLIALLGELKSAILN